MNIIHIGLGIQGKHWMSFVRRHPDVTPLGYVDPDSSALQWVKTNFPELSCSQDLEALSHKISADAAIIAGTPWLRATHAIKALEAGLTVLVEAPFATSLTDAARVLDVSRRTGKLLLVAAPSDTIPGDSMLRRLLDSKRVGTITHVSWIDRRSVSSEEDASVPYSHLVSVGVHHFERLRRILRADPVSLIARCNRSAWSPYQHGSTTEAFVKMENNIHFQYFGSLTSRQNEHILWIEGDKGVLKVENSRIWWRKLGWRFFVPLSLRRFSLQEPVQDSESLLSQLDAGVRGDLGSRTNNEGSLRLVTTLETVMQSDKNGEVVEIPQLPSALKVAGGSLATA